MLIDSLTVFDGFPDSYTDDEIIDFALKILYENEFGQGYLFEHQRKRFDELTVKRVINTMVINNLVTTEPHKFYPVYGINVIISEHGKFVSGKGGWLKYIEEQKQIEQEEKQKEDYKRQLELLKTQLEVEKLKYEESIRDLDEEVKRLTKLNMILQNTEIIYRWAIGLGGVVAGFFLKLIIEHLPAVLQWLTPH